MTYVCTARNLSCLFRKEHTVPFIAPDFAKTRVNNIVLVRDARILYYSERLKQRMVASSDKSMLLSDMCSCFLFPSWAYTFQEDPADRGKCSKKISFPSSAVRSFLDWKRTLLRICKNRAHWTEYGTTTCFQRIFDNHKSHQVWPWHRTLKKWALLLSTHLRFDARPPPCHTSVRTKIIVFSGATPPYFWWCIAVIDCFRILQLQMQQWY